MPHRYGQSAPRVGDLRRLSITVSQAARILDIGAKEVRTAIDRHVVTATLVQQGGRSLRTLDGIDLLCLRMRDILHHDVRRQIYTGLKQAPDAQRFDEPFALHGIVTSQDSADAIFNVIHKIVAETLSDAQSLANLSHRVNTDGRIRGTDVEAHRIAALVAGGMSVDDIVLDYPNLDAAMVEAAVEYAQVNPKQGRPYPARTVKSTLRKGGGGGLAAAFAAARDD